MAFGLVIFDCDGVLVDSEPIANRVLGQLLQEFGLTLTPEAMRERFVGHAMAHCLAQASALLGRALPPDFEARHDQRLFAALAAELAPVPGVMLVLEQLPLPYCVASNASPAKLRFSLAQVGLLPRLEGRLSAPPRSRRASPRRICSCMPRSAWACRRLPAW